MLQVELIFEHCDLTHNVLNQRKSLIRKEITHSCITLCGVIDDPIIVKHNQLWKNNRLIGSSSSKSGQKLLAT
jgi:hypothetical protein